MWCFFKATDCGLWFQIRLPIWLNGKILIFFPTSKPYSGTRNRWGFAIRDILDILLENLRRHKSQNT
jgi:hypothetical protein